MQYKVILQSGEVQYPDSIEGSSNNESGLDDYPLWEQNLEREIQGINDRE